MSHDPWKPKTLRSIAENLDGLRQLARSYNAGNPADRVAKLQKNIGRLATMFETAAPGSRGQISVSDLWHITEATEMADFMPALLGCPSEVLTDRLPVLFSGPDLPEHERAATNSNRPRNIAFELNLTSRLLASGHSVKHVDRVDVVTEVDDFTFFVQCKRALSERRFRSLAQEAYNQLKRDLPRSPSTTVGVIALSVGRILNPKSGHFVGTNRHTEDLIDIQLTALSRKYATLWRSIGDQRVIGVILHALIPGYYPQERLQISPIQRAISLPLRPHDIASSDTLRKLTKALTTDGFYRDQGVFRDDA